MKRYITITLTITEKQKQTLINELLYRVPVLVTEFRTFIISGNYPVCPRCRNSLDREYMSFCNNCGQKLSWKYFSYKKSKNRIT